MVKLAVRSESGVAEVRVEIGPKATVADFVTALEGVHGPPIGPCAALGNARTGEQLALSARLSATDLRDGDELTVLQTASGATSRTAARLRIVGGPAVNTTFEVGRGAHTVGGTPDSHIVLPDPSIQPGQTFRLVVEPAGVRVLPASHLGTDVYLNGAALRAPHMVWPGDIVEIGATSLTIELKSDFERTSPSERTVRRAPRQVERWQPVQLPLDAPPAPPRNNRVPLVSALLPLLLVPVLWFAGVRGPAILVLVLLSPLIAIGSRLEERFGNRRQYHKLSEQWRADLAEQLEALREQNEHERTVRDRGAPAIATLLTGLATAPLEVWQRQRGDDDFLTVRVGTATANASNTVALARGGAPEAAAAADVAVAEARSTPAMPVTLDISAHQIIGVTGTDAAVDAVAHAWVAQLVLDHGPADLAIAAAVGSERAAAWDWLGWLPHTDRVPGVKAVLLGAGPAGAQDVLRRLTASLSAASAPRPSSEATRGPPILLVLDASVMTQPETMRDLLIAAGDRLHILLLSRDARQFPRECTASVAVPPTGGGILRESGQQDVDAITLNWASAPDVAGAARALAGLIDPAVARGSAELPTSIGLLTLLGLGQVGPREIADRWAAGRTPFQADVGRGLEGPMTVDLASNHALIGGTTGSGKSELLQTLVCSLAVTTSPQRLNFLFIDYKGGAAFRDLVPLPHTAGYVTDLDPHLTQRTLISLRAEMRRRLAILDEHRLSSIEEMERVAPDQAPARLVIIVDEFATLVREAPDFIDGIVDLAARGRSVGIRVVLATQRPAGIVTDKMRTNIGLRMSLRVNDEADSIDIIGTRDAAHLPPDAPGRAVARLAGGRTVEFQAGYVGASTATTESKVLIRPLGLATGRAQPEGPSNLGADTRSDLTRIVDTTAQAAKRLGFPRPRAPWLRPLPDVLPLNRLSGVPTGVGADRLLVLGAADDPERQRQGIGVVDLDADGHLLIFGSGHSGKTSALRTAASSLAQRCAPDQVQIYGLDFASRGLAALEVLPHVGAIATADEVERVSRVLGGLANEVTERKQRFAATGATTLTEFRTASGESLPRLVLLVDGYASLATSYERDPAVLATLNRLVVDGRQVGVHTVIATERPIGPAGLGALTSAISRRLILRLGNDSDYSALGLRPGERGAALEPGRGWLDGLETQVALLTGDLSGSAQQAALESLAQTSRDLWPGQDAPRVEILPNVVDRALLPTAAAMAATVGRSFETLAPCQLSARHGHAMVLGPPRSGRTTALRTLLLGVAASTPGARITCLCPSRVPITGVDDVATVIRRAEIPACLSLLLDELMAQGPAPTQPRILVIDDGDELADVAISGMLEKIAAFGPDDGLWIMAAAEVQASRSGPSWVRALRRERHGLLLDATGTDVELLGARVTMGSRNTTMPGRGFLVVGGGATLVQVAS